MKKHEASEWSSVVSALGSFHCFDTVDWVTGWAFDM